MCVCWEVVGLDLQTQGLQANNSTPASVCTSDTKLDETWFPLLGDLFAFKILNEPRGTVTPKGKRCGRRALGLWMLQAALCSQGRAFL